MYILNMIYFLMILADFGGVSLMVMDGQMDGRTDGWTHPLIERTHLKMKREIRFDKRRKNRELSPNFAFILMILIFRFL